MELTELMKTIITEQSITKWIRKGNSYWLGDYIRVEFSKVGSSIYADVYLPKLATSTGGGLLYRYNNAPLIGVKKTLEYIGNIDAKHNLDQLTMADADTDKIKQILNDFSKGRHDLRHDQWNT